MMNKYNVNGFELIAAEGDADKARVTKLVYKSIYIPELIVELDRLNLIRLDSRFLTNHICGIKVDYNAFACVMNEIINDKLDIIARRSKKDAKRVNEHRLLSASNNTELAVR